MLVNSRNHDQPRGISKLDGESSVHKPKIKYHQRNGCGCYSLNGKPLSIEDEQLYQIEMRQARELYHHHKEFIDGLPQWIKSLGKRFNIKAISLYL